MGASSPLQGKFQLKKPVVVAAEVSPDIVWDDFETCLWARWMAQLSIFLEKSSSC